MERTGPWGPCLRAYRERYDLTLRDVAEELCRLALDRDGQPIGVNEKMVSRYELGKVRPSPRYQTLFCALYDATPAELGFHRPLPVHGDGYSASNVRRRAFIRLAAGATLGPFLEDMRRDIDLAFGRRSVDEWEEAVLALGREKATVPAAELATRLIADLNELVGVLHEDPRLAHVAASLSELTAGLLVRLDDPASARRWYATAWKAARASGDPELAAFVVGQQAIMELYGDQSRVLGLADRALAAAKTVPCAGVMSGLSARAHVLAITGRDREARVALAAAERMFDRLPATVTGDRLSHFAWAEQRMRTLQGFVWSRLGDTRRALDAQDVALSLYPAERSRAVTRVQLDRAVCLIRDGDVTEGARYATASMSALPDDQRTRVVRAAARDVLSVVPPRARKLPAVTEYREVIAA